MRTALRFLSEDEQKRIASLVQEAEKKTGAEIVLAVATESGRYDRAEGLVGGATALLALLACDVLFASLAGADGWSHGAPLSAQCAAVVVGLLVGNVLASFVHPIRRFFTSQTEMAEEVERAAERLYARARVGETTHGAGLLVYISLFERRVVLLVDGAVRKVVSHDLAVELRDAAVAGLKKGERAQVLEEIVRRAATALEGRLPTRPEAANELADHVLILHPR